MNSVSNVFDFESSLLSHKGNIAWVVGVASSFSKAKTGLLRSQLHQALAQETIDELAQQTGLPHDDLLSQLSKILPGVVDKLTPNGQLPSETDMLPGPRQSRRSSGLPD